MSIGGIEWGYCEACGKEVPVVTAKGERLLEDHFESGGFSVQVAETHDMQSRVSHGPKCPGSWKCPSLPPDSGDDETRRFRDDKATLNSGADSVANEFQSESDSSFTRQYLNRAYSVTAPMPNPYITSTHELPSGSVVVDGIDISDCISAVTIVPQVEMREAERIERHEIFRHHFHHVTARYADLYSPSLSAIDRERIEVVAMDARSDPTVTWPPTPAEGRRELIRMGFDPDAPFTELHCDPDAVRPAERFTLSGRFTLTQEQHSADVTEWIRVYSPIISPGGIITEIRVN